MFWCNGVNKVQKLAMMVDKSFYLMMMKLYKPFMLMIRCAKSKIGS